MDVYGKTERRDNEDAEYAMPTTEFYKHSFQGADYGFSIFSSDDIVNAVKANIPETKRRYYFDGTFKITPLGVFMQVLIISIDFLGQVRTHSEL